MTGDIADLRIEKDGGGRRGAPWAAVIVSFLVGAAAGAGSLHLALRGERSARDEAVVQTAQALPPRASGQDPQSPFTAGGWIEPAFPCPRTVVSLVKGRIDKVLVQDGQAVKAGDAVAEIYSRDFIEELALAQAGLEVEKGRLAVERANLALLRAGYRTQDVDEARARLRELEAEVVLWESVSRRSSRLAADGAVSSEQAQSDASAFETRKARRDAQKALLAKLEEGIRAEEIAKQAAEVARTESLVADAEARVKIASTALEYTIVRSPVDGVVLKSYRETGDSVNPASAESSRIVSIYDPEKLWARVDVTQSDLGRIAEGQPAEVKTDSSRRSYKARAIRKNPLASFAKNTVEVKVEILDPDGLLHPDMTARITFQPVETPAAPGSAAGQGPPLVPASAVLREASGEFVMVVADSFARKRTVKTGEEKDGRIQILAGLKAGETVVAADPGTVRDGQKVRIAPAK